MNARKSSGTRNDGMTKVQGPRRRSTPRRVTPPASRHPAYQEFPPRAPRESSQARSSRGADLLAHRVDRLERGEVGDRRAADLGREHLDLIGAGRELWPARHAVAVGVAGLREVGPV